MDFDNQDHGKFQGTDGGESFARGADRTVSHDDAHLQAGTAAAAPAGQGAVEVLVPNAENVIILPPGVELDTISIQGRDLVVVGEDGTRFVIPDGAIVVPQLVVDGVSVPPLNLAALLIGQEPQPAAGAPQSSGGNFADPVGDIQKAYDLGNLLPYTELQFPQPQQEEIIPGLVDRKPGVIVITPDQPAGAESATATVNEAALGAPHDPPGTNPSSNAETTTGSIDYSSPDGLSSLAINGVAVTQVGQTFTTPYGVLTITSIAPGSIGYSYTLTDNMLGQTSADVFAVTVTDVDGDTASASLSINVIDDAPIAHADTDTIAAGTYGPESGNVMTGAGTTSGAAGADQQGADGAAVSGASGSGGNGIAQSDGSFVVSGAYGTLTIAPDGSYDYVRAPGTPGGVTDTFNYTLTDGDGDTASASLVITIADSPAAVTSVPTTGPGTIVDESGLLARPGEAAGSDAGSGANQTTGTIEVKAPDGIASVEINGVVVTGPGQTIDTDHGYLTIVDYNPTTGEIDYQYTLTDNTAGDGSIDTVTVKVTDTDGDSDQKPFDIHIVDDVPTAVADHAAQAAPGDAVTVNVLANDVQGADSVQAGTVTYVDGTLSGTGTLVNNGDGTFTYTPANGENGSITFDYTITDGDGDTSTATVTIDVLDRPTSLTVPTAGDAGTLVDEGALATGSHPASTAEQTSGQITFSAPDGVQSLTIDGQPVAAGNSYTGSFGTLTVTAVDTNAGTIDYTYLLTTNTSGDATADSFAVQVTDVDGDSSSANLVVGIIDDVPTAVNDDLVSVAEDAAGTVGGNVLANDTQGADDASVVSVTIDGTVHAVDPTAGVTVITGEGTYVIGADGNWTFDPATGQNQTSGPIDTSFTYTIEDGDGDQSSATQPIQITDGAGPSAPAAQTIVVDDQTLIDGSTPAATQPPSGSATLAFTPGSDAIASIVFGDTSGLEGGLTWTRASDTTINGYDGGRLVVTLTLEVSGDSAKVVTTLVDNYIHPTAGGDQTTGIGTATVVATDIDGDTATGSVGVSISDDLPTLAVGAPVASALTVDETALGTSSGAIDFSGLFTPDYNADSNGTIGGYKLGISAEGAATGLVDTATGEAVVLHMNGSTVEGVTAVGGDVVFTLTVSTGGEVELTQLRAIVHGDTGSDNESSVALDPALVTMSATATDGDGDQVTAAANIGGAITFLDDGPSVTGANAIAYLDDDALAGGNPGGTGDGPDALNLTGTLVHSFGNDGGAIAIDSLTAAGFSMTSAIDGTTGHQIVSIQQMQGGSLVTVVTVDLDPASGAYTVAQVANVLHSAGGAENDQVFTLGYTVTDGDHDTATGTLVIDVNDDTPVAQPDTNSLTEDSATATGNVLTGDAFGADGKSATTPISAVHGDNLNVAGAVGGATQGEWGSLTLGSDGQYTYTLDQSKVQFLDDGESRTDTFSYTIVDGDGDTSTTTLTITINGANDAPVGSPDTNWVLDVTTGADPTTSGNVLLSVDHNSPAAPSGTFADQADTDVDGDTLSVTQFTHGATTVAAGGTVGGDYGSISIAANGSYTYTLNSGNAAVEALNSGDTLTDTFTYTVTDGDLTTTQTVTITIFGVDSAPIVTGSAVAVSEEGLPGGLPDDNPTSPADADTTDSRTANGAISISDTDSSSFTVTLGTPATTLHTADGSTALTWQVSADGHTLIAYSTDETQPELVVTIDNTGAYTVTLNAPVQHGDTTIEDTLSFNIPVTVHDSENNAGNPASIAVTIEDDSPTAHDYAGGSFAEGSGAHDLGVATTLLGIAGGGDGLKDTLQDIAFTNQGTTGGTVVIDATGHLIYTAPTSVANTAGAPVSETFSYTVTDADGDHVTHTVTFSVTDTGISAVSATALVADEDDISGAGGNPGGPGDVAQATTGHLSFTLGADALASITLSATTGLVKLDGTTAVSTSWDAGTHTLTGYGTDASDVVFTITLTNIGATGADYAIEWFQPVQHPGHDDPNLAGTQTSFEDSLTFAINVALADADGSTGSTSFNVTINDDSPIVDAVATDGNAITATTHDHLTIGAASDVATADFAGAFATNGAGTSYGADGAGTTTWSYGLSIQQASGFDTGLTSDGHTVYLLSTGGMAVGSTSTDPADTNAWVFSVAVNSTSGQVTLTQYAELDHAPNGATGSYDAQTLPLPTGLISLTGTATITDADGDTTSDAASIDLGGNLLFADDGPHAIADTNNVVEGATAAGNVLLGSDGAANTSDDDTFGADGPAATSPAGGVVGVKAGSDTSTAVTTGINTTIHGSYGDLVLHADGSYTYTVAANSVTANQVDTFVYTIADGDGDYSTTTLTINVANVTLTAADSNVTVYEKAMDGVLDPGDVAVGGHGSNPSNTGETATGTIAVSGAASYAINGGTTGPSSTNGNLTTYHGTYGTLVLNTVTGAYTYTLTAPYTTTPNANDGVTTALNAEQFSFVATDTNLNSASGTIHVAVVDDVPTGVTPDSLTMNNVSGTASGYLDADHLVSDNLGADGGKVIFTAATITALQAEGLTSGFSSLSYSISSDGTVLTATKSSDSTTVFTIELQPSGSADQYVVHIAQPLDATSNVNFTDGSYQFVGGNTAWAGFVGSGTGSHDLLLTPAVGGADASTINQSSVQYGVGSGNSIGLASPNNSATAETFRLDFVTDLSGNSAGSGGYGVPANQDHVFAGHYQTNGASVLFTASSGTTLKFAAYDDIDSDNDVGDGLLDHITGVALSYKGYTTGIITPTSTLTSYTIGPVGDQHTYTVVLNADGTVNVGGIYGTSGASAQGTTVAIYTDTTGALAPGELPGYNSLQFTYVSGSDVKVGDFGASVISHDPVNFTVPVTVQDGDGDLAASAPLAITLNYVAPPVVLDLNGDGVHFVGTDAGVTFDYNGDGNHEATAWASADDGILAIDINGDGKITSTSEFIFGGNGLSDLQGLAARYDSNHDGVLDANDAGFAKFGVWQDANLNGVTDPGEFVSLAKLGIASISLTSDGQSYTTAGGDVTVVGTGSFTRADGTTGELADAAFATEARSQQRTAETITTAALASAVLYPLEAAAREVAPASEHVKLASADLAVQARAPLAETALDADHPAHSAAAYASLLENASASHVEHAQSHALHAPADSVPAAVQAGSHAALDSAAAGDAPVAAGADHVAAFSAGAAQFAMADGSEGVMMQAILALQAAPAAGGGAKGAAAIGALQGALSDFAGETTVDAIVDHFTAGGSATGSAPVMNLADAHGGAALSIEALDSHVFSGLAQFSAGVPDHIDDAAATAAMTAHA